MCPWKADDPVEFDLRSHDVSAHRLAISDSNLNRDQCTAYSVTGILAPSEGHHQHFHTHPSNLTITNQSSSSTLMNSDSYRDCLDADIESIMPTLKQLTCNVEWTGSKLPLREYHTIYADGYVETYIPVPSTPTPFSIHLRSHGYIAPGIAMFVYASGARVVSITSCTGVLIFRH